MTERGDQDDRREGENLEGENREGEGLDGEGREPAGRGPEGRESADQEQSEQPSTPREQPTEEVFSVEKLLGLDGGGESSDAEGGSSTTDFDALLEEALDPSTRGEASPSRADRPVPINAPESELGAEEALDHPGGGEKADEGGGGPASEQTAEWDLDDGAETDQSGAEAAQPAAAQPAGTPPSFGPLGENDHEKPPRRPRIFLSFFVAAILIIGSIAGASSATVIMYLGDIASKLRENSLDVGGAIVSTSSGEPQTILIVGTDKRSSDAEDRPPLSDTAMLVRLDPNRDAIAVMSIPRDLKVEIPGHGVDKFNAAYAYGGPELTLRTIRRLTGGLDVNHIVNVDFVGFIRVVDEIECIYVNVDRHYFNSNEGVSAHLQYAEIDIEPGYQRLCGEKALDYARYRHTDNDLVRAARQQEVIRAARERVPIGKLISDRNRMIEIFTDYTTSDIQETGQIIELMNLAIDARNATISEIHFPGVAEEIVPGRPAYVIADPGDVRAAVDRFLGIEASRGPRGTMERDAGEVEQQERMSQRERRQQRRQERREQRERLSQAARAESDGLVDASEGARNVALTATERLGPSLPVFYPRRLPSGAIFVQDPRIYHVEDVDGENHGAYSMVLQMQQGDFFNVQGIREWTDPPILDAPHEVLKVGDREMKVFLDGDRIRLIAWHAGNNTYWITNSLLLTLTNDQMLGMARTMGVEVPEPKSRVDRLAIIAEREAQ